MVDDFRIMKLGDVCTKIGSGSTPRGGASVYLEKGICALIRSQNVHNDAFKHEGLVYLKEENAKELSNVEVFQGDVLLNITGDSVARVCQVDPAILPARVNQHVAIIRPDNHQLCPKFLRYYLVSPKQQERLLTLASAGATRQALTKSMIETFEIVVPPSVRKQQAIASILGALDDKIELNRQRNRTLEAMARALFQSWFVDFDPVKAKAAGKQPSGLKPEIAALFPNSFEESELGPTPKGWGITSVDSVLALSRESITPCDFPSEVFHHYSLPAFDAGQHPARDDGNSIKSQKLLVPEGSVLVSKLNPRTPRIWVPDLSTKLRSIASTEFLVCCPKTNCGIGRSFLYCFASEQGFSDYLTSRSSGTSNSHQRVRPQDFLSYRFVMPSTEANARFEAVSAPLLENSLQIRRENRTITSIRDALLPKLISGELRIPDAERIVARTI